MFAVEHRTRIRRGRARAHQLQAVARTTQPIIRLAAILAKLDKELPRRRGKRLELLLAYMILLGDWRSGRRSRPGRATAAAILGTGEEYVRQLWRRCEALGLIERTAEGTRLPHAVVRLQKREEYHVAERAEWTVRLPAGIYAEDVTPDHVAAAVEVFAALAERLVDLDADLAPLRSVLDGMSEAWQRLADTRTEQGNGPNVGPIYGFLFSVVPSKVRSSSPPTAYGRTTKADGTSCRPISATKSQGADRRRPRRRRMNADAVGLAHELRHERRLPQLRDANVAILAATVHSRAIAGWTASDVVRAVEAACQRRAERFGYYDPPKRQDVQAAAAWLKRMLAEVVDLYPVETPPHRAAAERAEQLRAEREAEAERRRAEQRDRATRSTRPRIVVPARRRPYGGHTRPEDTFAQTAAGRGRAARRGPREGQDELAAAWRPPAPAGPRCELCGEPGADVECRFLPSRGSVEVCEGCHAWHSANPILLDLDLGL